MNGSKPLAFFTSPVGKKIATGITGLGLTLFVILHMVGNLSYFSNDPDAYNRYSHFLIGLGPLFYVVEIGLLAFFIFHMVLGVNIFLGKRRARKIDYAKYRSAGTPSLQSVGSRSMILTGIILFVFLVLHLLSFKYGPGVEAGYVATIDGIEMRNLKRLLEERFKHPFYAFGYVAVMVLLGLHLRHGIWSAFQSLGAMKPRLTPFIYMIGGIVAVLVAVGFLVLPLWIYFGL